MTTEKAYIALTRPQPGGAEIGRVTFMFNPKEFSYKKEANWQSKPAKGAKSAPRPEFNGAQPTTLSVEVFLDAWESGDSITKDIDLLTSCCMPLPDTISSKKPSPPWVLFGWGTRVHITAFVKSVDVKCTMFKPDGTPIRASCTVVMQELPPAVAKQNPTSGSVTNNRVRTVVTGDSLASIAYQEYRQPAAWRALAEVNNIDDPLRLPAGTRLLVPDLDEIDESISMGTRN